MLIVWSAEVRGDVNVSRKPQGKDVLVSFIRTDLCYSGAFTFVMFFYFYDSSQVQEQSNPVYPREEAQTGTQAHRHTDKHNRDRFFATISH